MHCLERFEEIREYIDRFENLFLVGRNGMHKYNNQDHSMLTAMTAVDNIVAGRTDKQNIWALNTEMEYHESKVQQVKVPLNLNFLAGCGESVGSQSWRQDCPPLTIWRNTMCACGCFLIVAIVGALVYCVMHGLLAGSRGRYLIDGGNRVVWTQSDASARRRLGHARNGAVGKGPGALFSP